MLRERTIAKPSKPARTIGDLPIKKRRVAVCVSKGMSLSSAFIACAPLEAVNRLYGDGHYTIEFVGPALTQLKTGIGFEVDAAVSFNDNSIFDIVIVIAACQQSSYYMQELSRFLRRQVNYGAELCGVDVGVTLLAEAGFLSGHLATTHWEVLESALEQFPSVRFCDDLYVIDRKRLTCGGHMVCQDLFLALIERNHGSDVRKAVVEEIGGQSPREPDTKQINPLSWDPTIRNAKLRQAVDIMQENIEEPLSIPQIADQVGTSLRQLQNLSRLHFGETLSERYLVIRLNTARNMLTYGNASITNISLATGFTSPAVFARAFRARFDMTATEYRENFLQSAIRPFVV